MKILSLKLSSHKILGDFLLDFRIDNKLRNFSLLVGENGCGKTVLLEEIYKIINGGVILWDDNVDREITFLLSDTEKNNLGTDQNIITIIYKAEGDRNFLRITVFGQSKAEITQLIRPKIQNGEFNKLLKGAYSTIEINFSSKDVDAVRATDVDIDKQPKTRSNPDLASEIAQLLVDIKAQDDAVLASWMRQNENKESIRVPKIEGKFERFQNAYARMFDAKILYDTKPDGGKHKILFKDLRQNMEFDISGLSSGEKQVVYRAGYLLKNLKNLNKGIILIDEPELSLHPKWQLKYLDFLRELFNNTGDVADIQFLIATHSPFVLKEVLREDVAIFVFNKGADGKILVQNTCDKDFGILKRDSTWGEICYFSYDLPTVEFHDDLYSTIEDKLKITPTQEISQVDVENWLGSNGQSKEIKWLSSVNGPQEETLMTYIRNRIHHPDNIERPKYSPEQLRESIKRMINLLENKN